MNFLNCFSIIITLSCFPCAAVADAINPSKCPCPFESALPEQALSAPGNVYQSHSLGSRVPHVLFGWLARYRARSPFIQLKPSDERERIVDIYRHGKKDEQMPYREYLGHTYSDLWEYLESRYLSSSIVMDIMKNENQSVLIGIPTLDSGIGFAGRKAAFESVLHSMEQYKKSTSGPVQLVICVNGLGQEKYLEELLIFQRHYKVSDIPIIILMLPMEGRLPGEKGYGKTNAMNAIVRYGRGVGATIVGFIDDDTPISQDDISENVGFLRSKAMEYQSPVLAGSRNITDQGNPRRPWNQSPPSPSVRGPSMFAFLFSIPPLPSYPINDDLYLRLYFDDLRPPAGKAFHWRILPNPKTDVLVRYTHVFKDMVRQYLRWLKGDLWTMSLVDPSKAAFVQQKSILTAFKLSWRAVMPWVSALDKDEAQRRLFLAYLRPILRYWIWSELEFRRLFRRPLISTRWSNSVPVDTKALSTSLSA